MGLAQNHQDWIIYLMKKIEKMETNVAENEKETEKGGGYDQTSG